MTKATENELAELHAALAKAYRKELESGEITPALLTSASNFLKNNSITCDVERDEDMKAVRDQASAALQFPFSPEELQH